jgi:hypothetical protein
VSKLLEMAARCEAATGNDFVLLRDAGNAFFNWKGNTDKITRHHWAYDEWLGKGAAFEAAKSLIPQGSTYQIGFSAGRYSASIGLPDGRTLCGDSEYAEHFALVAAALKTRHAIAMEAATAGETAKQGSTRSATARARKDIAQTPPPNLSQGDTP